MRTINNFKGIIFPIVTFLLLFLSACNNDDEPVDPIDPPHGEEHEQWTKVTFTFHMGHLHGENFHGNPYNENVQYFKAVQEVSYEYEADGTLSVPDEPIRFIKGETYAMEIKYYDADGDLINSEFGEEENSPLHQHFFLTKDAKQLNSTDSFPTPDTILGYTYRDTDPVDENIKEDNVVLRVNDPLGLKGYFTVNEKYTAFNLNVILVHIVTGDKFDENGLPSPFNQPNPTFLSIQDLNLKVPVRVYTERPDEDTFDLFINDMATEFNITPEEAEEDWYIQVDTPHDSGNYWM